MSSIRIYKAGLAEAGAGEVAQRRYLANAGPLVLQCCTFLGQRQTKRDAGVALQYTKATGYATNESVTVVIEGSLHVSFAGAGAA